MKRKTSYATAQHVDLVRAYRLTDRQVLSAGNPFNMEVKGAGECIDARLLAANKMW